MRRQIPARNSQARLRLLVKEIGEKGGLLLALTLLSAATANSAVVTGRVQITGRRGAPAPVAVVYAEPLDGVSSPQAGKTYSMAQRKKAFVPNILVVPAGSTVNFPNEDLIFHNVFSLSQPAPFDLGLYRAGVSKARTFASPGTYRIFCNIHPEMTAVILVVPTSYIAQTDAQGNYQINLPAGRYRLTARSPESQPTSVEIEVSSAGARLAGLNLDESQAVEEPHKNKFGQDYPKGSYDPIKGRTKN